MLALTRVGLESIDASLAERSKKASAQETDDLNRNRRKIPRKVGAEPRLINRIQQESFGLRKGVDEEPQRQPGDETTSMGIAAAR